MADQLVTIAQVKARVFPNGVSDTNDDALFTELVEQVTSWTQTFTGRRFIAEPATTFILDGPGGYVLRVPRGVRALTTVATATTDQPDTGGTYTTLTATDFLLRPAAADLPQGWPATEVRIRSGATGITYWPIGQNRVKLIGDFGWAAVPPDLQAAAIDAVVNAYQRRKNGQVAVAGVDGTPFPPSSPIVVTAQAYAYGSV